MAAIAILLGGFSAASAQEPCYNACTPEPCNTPECTTAPCNTPQCEAQSGFETIGQGAKQAAQGSYNTVKEGTVNTYEKAANGVETGYEKTKEGVTEGYNTVKEGTVNTYEKAANGVKGLWNKAKEKIHEATE